MKEARPYIVFEVTRNPGRKPREKTIDGKKVEVFRGEFKEEWPCYLADKNGELHPWATPEMINYYILAKGYRPIEMGGFDEFFLRKDPQHELVMELRKLEAIVKGYLEQNSLVASKDAEIEKLRKQLATKGAGARKNESATIN